MRFKGDSCNCSVGFIFFFWILCGIGDLLGDFLFFAKLEQIVICFGAEFLNDVFFSLHKPLYSFNICPLLKYVRLHFDLDLGQPS